MLLLQCCLLLATAARSSPVPAPSPAPFHTSSLDNVFISVKTTAKHHRDRLVPLLDTWHSLVPQSTWIFTDGPDSQIESRAKLIQTGCPADYARSSLCCKMQVELTTFLSTNRDWFCHLDDDNFLLPASLAQLLAKHDPAGPVYLGRASISAPLDIQGTSFLFGTGGAGFCLSRVAAAGVAAAGVQRTGDRIGLPDDVTVGFLAQRDLNLPLTQVSSLHSHLEPLSRLDPARLGEQVTLSYSGSNRVQVEGEKESDPTTFYSLHCRLHGVCRTP